MTNFTLAKAISLSLAGAAISLGATSNAAAHTMYNTYNAYASNIGTDDSSGGTDGWTVDFNLPSGGWVGTAGWTPTGGVGGAPGGGVNPFGSVGLVTHWAAEVHDVGDTLEISSQDAFNNYGVWADIDTAKGAWNDKGPNGPALTVVPPNPTPTYNVGQGWGHHTDVGLFKSDVATRVTISPTALQANSGGWNNFGITVFSGMDTGGSYDHHGGWNAWYRPASHPSPLDTTVKFNNPLGTVGLTFLEYSDSGDISFNAQPGQVYSILLGGYSGPGNFGPVDGYKLNITTAPVPVPAAVWLFGSALAGMGVIGRRKEKASA